MVFAQYPLPPCQGVLIQLPRRRVFTQAAQVGGEAMRGVEGVRVVLAEHPLPPCQGVLIQLPRRASQPRSRRSGTAGIAALQGLDDGDEAP